ncbi:MAG TPA: signal peptidase I [Actinomycetota bacterium]|nr:signal peptidase I [Actinomycetota bacterium]
MADRPGGDEQPAERAERFWRELPILLIAALAIAIVVKTFLIQAFFIPSISMSPTLERGDRILVCRICTRLGDVERGDVVVFSDPNSRPGPERGPIGAALHWLGEGIGVAQPEHEDFIKRVIGVPGDVVELHDGRLFVNGQRIEEPYLNPEIDTSAYGPVSVPDGMLFVLGDNRAHSGDSRFPPPTGLGFVPEDKVIGKAFVIVFPLSRWGWL